MSVILPQIPARLRRMLGRFVGPAGAALFSLVLASCAGGGFGGAPDTPAVNPASQPAPATSGPISPASQRNVAEALSGLKLGDETPPISPEDIAVSDDAEILNRNPFSSSAPAARASGWGARADSTRKTQGYKAFEVAVPSENPLMTVAVWISETPPDYPEGKPEQDPESDRKFLYLRLQVFIEVGHVALVEGGGVEVLDSQVIVVEEKRPDPKPHPVTLEAVTAETVCESGSLSTNGLAQAELDAGLISAAEDNDLEGACEYLRRGANVDARESGRYYKRTALMIAANDGFLDLAKLLHANGADVNLYGGTHDGNFYGRDRRGYPALHYAGVAGHPELVGWLLDSGAELNSEWESGKTALWDAAYWGRPDVVELLLSRGAETETYYNGGATPLHAAVMLEGVSARRYWANGPAFRYKQMALAYSYPTPTADEHGQVVSLLLSHDAEVNARYQFRSDSGGRSPLDYAARQGDERLSAMLRDAGGICFVETGPLCPVVTAVTTAVTIVASTVVTAETICESGSLSANGLTQAQLDAGLISAAEGNDLAGACEYLRRGADVETREATPFYGGHRRTPLMIAANLGFVDVAGLLLGNGANVNRQVVQYSGTAGGGWSALHYASGAGHQDMAEYLLDQGADVGAKWSWGRSVLFEASFYAHWETVELLLSRGADVGEADAEGLTPLHAVGYGEGALFPSGELRRSAADGARVVALLLDAGADVNARGLTSGRKSPLDVAVSRHRLSQSATLRAAGGYCYVQTSSLCAYPPVVTAVTLAVTTTVTSETVCESGSLSANGQTQAQLDAGLVSAAKANDLASACEYLRRGADVETREATPFYGGHRRTPLMIAANLGFVDVAGLLLGNGANVNRQVVQYSGTAGGGWSALHYASGAGHQDMAEYLLDQGADVGAKWSWGRSVLFEASFYAHWETVELLLSRGADVGEADAEGLTPLHAVGYGEGALFPSGELRRSAADGARVVALLLDAGADVNARGLTSGRKSPLDVAVSRHRLSQSATLRAAGGYCYVQTSSLCAYPPVVTAVTLAVTTTVTSETVCESGSLSANGQTQAQLDAGLVSAAKANDLASACEYLRRGADVETREATPFYGGHRRTPLMIAANLGFVDVAGLLLGNGANVNRQVVQYSGTAGGGWSALHYASGAGHQDMAEYLLDQGADVGAKWSWGRSVLFEASFYAHWETVELLLSRGADVGEADAEGLTPLHAVGYGEGALFPSGELRRSAADGARVVALLLDAGADVNARGLTSGRKSPLDVAVSRHRLSQSATLRAAGGYCYVQTSSLCAYPPVVTAVTLAVTTTVTSETVCESGSLSANGLTQAELDAGLLSAAKANNLANACEYLRRGASPDSRETRGYYRTALIVAADRNYPEMAGLLLSNGADADEGGARSWGDWAVRDWAALHYATSRGYAEVVRVLLEGGADADIRESRDRRPLFEAAFHGRLDIAELLLSHGAELDARDRWNTTALLGAVSMGSYGEYSPGTSPQAMVVSLLISRGANVNARTNVSGGESALDVAARHFRTTSRPHGGDAERYAEILRNHGGRCFVETGPLCGIPDVAVEYAVIPADESGGTVSAEGDDGVLSHEDEVRQGTTLTFTATPALGWMLSAWGGDAADCSGFVCALAANSDLSVHAEFSPILSLTDLSCPAGTLPTNGLTAAELNMTLRMASRGGDATRVCEALRRGAEVNDNLDDSEFTPLQEAVSGGHLEAAKVLLANGAEVNKRKDGAGHSPLDLAARDGEAEIAALLRNANGRCFVETGPLCQSVPVATPDPVTVVNTVAATVASTVVATVANTVVADVENTVASTVAAGSCPAGTLPTNGMTQAQLDAGLLSAASSGDLAEACEHLRRGANPNGRDQYEHVPLMRASSQADLEMGKLLLDNGADLTVVWVTGGRWTPLFAQYNGGYASARLAAQIEFYLSRGVDPNLGSSAWNPLHEAAYYNEWRSMKLLLDAGADPNIQTTRSGWRGGAPLHYVFDGTRSGSALAVSVLVAGDADVNLRDNYGRSALDLAANRGDAASAEILRAAGGQCFVSTRSLCEVVPVATPNPVTVVNTVAATVANTIVATVANTVVAAVENTVAATVAAGSCPAGTLPTNGMTQAQLDDGFLGAALENDVEEICEYLRRGANIEIRTDQVGRPHHTTALMIAGRNNYLDLARLLLSNGADVDSTGDLAGGWPALHYAAYAGHADVARVFLDAGANPDVGLEHFPSWKPLHEAAYYNNWRIMKVLLTSGANPNIQTARTGWRGGAPLHYVFDGTRSGSALAVSVLVAGGAEVNLRDSGGNSALDLAARGGDAASAEILRAAGGQCFVSTSSLCGSAPAPAAAAAESAPAMDRMRESFAGAFNPSPAFGDAFGAASGSSERFLSRLDSLMRSTSGSGGNVWDSFAGWQRENEHGRMWFSTGQRGDFGFGAGVGGAGGDLSASPFAAMVGNGMLAGGETGLGAAGKLRIAAFADYQARSLLDGTDRQWTKWAASGTAIETAMTEAERFSGLAENQTRGAMTEIHLGGGDLGVALQAGAVSESDAMLSGTADDEHLRGLRARTAFAGLSGAADLFGSGWRLRGSAHLGRSWAESERMLRDGDLWASAFSAGLERGGWLYSDDGFILRFSQPLRVESLEMDLIGADGASRLGADPSGRQLDVDAAYRLPLSGGGWLLLSAGVRRDGGHTSSSDLEAGALFSVERGF